MKNILVAHKKSTLEKYQASPDPHLRKVASDDIKNHGRLSQASDSHARTLDAVVSFLQKQELKLEIRHRADVLEVHGFDLVISVGGDGTVLDLSHKLHDTPILGVNSDPRTSVGYFCGTNANSFSKHFYQIQERDLESIELARFQVRKNGQLIGVPALNDILVSHINPAAVSSYILEVGMALPEVQKSSGLWISTAAGSTAAIRSAGGYVMPLKSSAIQYLVREPYPNPDYAYKLTKGMVERDRTFKVSSRMPDGRIYIDGPHLVENFSVGDELIIERKVPPLKIFGIGNKPRT